jgi:hypothetical protein|tara:strand:+ start:410 stop:637 length:228 start_codon:yes stop_codon:yes gene_type:complete
MNMKNVVAMVNDGLEGLTSILSGVIVLGIFSSIVFEGGVFGIDVIANLMSIIGQITNGGFAGLLALLVILGLWNK